MFNFFCKIKIFILTCSYILLVSTSHKLYANVIYSESWEGNTISTDSEHGLYNPTSSPHYCANPDPPDNCREMNGICSQTMGPAIPISQIPDPTCRHSLNVGGPEEGFPLPVDGVQIFRSYIDISDPAVKSHVSRSELVSHRRHPINAVKTDRWWGFAFRVPDRHDAFTYNNFNFMQWHTLSFNNGGPPLLIRLHGGLRDRWRDAIGIRVEQRYGATRNEVLNVLDINREEVPANRIDGNRVRETLILKNTHTGGNINDFGDWIYFVIRLNLDNRASGNTGRFTLWFASQSMLDSCMSKSMDCYLKAYDYGPGFRAGYADDNTSYVLIGGTLDSMNKDEDHYPIVTYFDNFKVADGEHAEEIKNFEEVNPAKPPSEKKSPANNFILLLNHSNSLQNKK